MMRTVLRFQKIVAGILIFSLTSVLFPFAAFAQTAVLSSSQSGNTLASIVQDTTGAVAAAAIACNKTQIQAGIKSLFGNAATGVSGSSTTDSFPAETAPTGGGTAMSVGGTNSLFPAVPEDLSAGTSNTDTGATITGVSGPSSTEADNPGMTGIDFGISGPSDTEAANPNSGAQQVYLAPAPTGDTNSYLKSIAQNSAKAAAAAQAQVNKTTCDNAIEKAAAGVILRQLTISTVNWINHGLNGNPFYSTDTASALKGVADTEVKTLNSIIGLNSTNYPFGKSVAQSIAAQLGSSFEQQSIYSLNAVIAQQYPGMTNADFQRSFGIGGWDAFLAQTSFNNNPFGFAMTAQNVVANRTAGTNYSPAQDLKDQLAQSGGFYSQKVCVDPNYSPNANVNATNAADSAAADKAAATNAADSAAADQLAAAQASGDQVAIQAAQARLNSLDALSAQANAALLAADNADAAANAKAVCNKYQIVTPGSVIGQSLSKALGATTDTLVNGQDLSTDITAIFNALSNQLINKGLSSLSTNTTSSSNFSQNSNGTVDNNQTSVAVDSTGSWASQGANFNVFTDIPSVMRNEDNTQNDTALISGCVPGQEYTTSGTFCTGDPTLPEGYQQILQQEIVAQENLIASIYELDYCIPGPHPGAIDSIDSAAQSFVENPSLFPASANASDVHKVLSTYGSSIGNIVGLGLVVTLATTGALVGSGIPGLGTLIGGTVGLIVGGILTAIGSNNATTNEDVYGPFVSALFGVQFNYNNSNNGLGKADLNGYSNSANIVTTLAHRYGEAMQMVYEPTLGDVQSAETAAAQDPTGEDNGQGSADMSIIGTATSTPISVTGTPIVASTATSTGIPPFTSTSTVIAGPNGPITITRMTVAPLPDLSTTNLARYKIEADSYSAYASISGITSVDASQFPQIQSYMDNVSQDETLIQDSQSVESQLGNLLSAIGNLPNEAGYPGVNGRLDLVPVITLNGSANMTITVGDGFTDPGATATDKIDGDISSKIVTVDNVNTSVPGIYTVTYDVTDSQGVAANQVTRRVTVMDANGNVGSVVPNSAEVSQSQSNNALLQASGANSAPSGTTAVRDYNADLLAIQNITDVQVLSPYEQELKQISATFNQLAPYIHGTDDLANEQASLDTMNNATAVIDPDPQNKLPGPTDGVLGQCIATMTNPKSLYNQDGGPTARVAFGFQIDDAGDTANMPAWLTTALPPQISFLPDWHFAQGGGVLLIGKNDSDPTNNVYPAAESDQEFFFPSYNGSEMSLSPNSTANASGLEKDFQTGTVTMDTNKLIRNDDVSTINVQPLNNAMEGLERVLGLY